MKHLVAKPGCIFISSCGRFVRQGLVLTVLCCPTAWTGISSARCFTEASAAQEAISSSSSRQRFFRNYLINFGDIT